MAPDCVICWEARANMVLVPCGHLCMCYECASSWARSMIKPAEVRGDAAEIGTRYSRDIAEANDDQAGRGMRSTSLHERRPPTPRATRCPDPSARPSESCRPPPQARCPLCRVNTLKTQHVYMPCAT